MQLDLQNLQHEQNETELSMYNIDLFSNSG